ncbi:TPA: hypothetical protein HA243_02105 [Candidatus Micrarchaeota archaeon]|nr:hypothetical protein [Candidatus Micrarchaeota archaeon]
MLLMKKCKGCGKWWNENDRRILTGRLPASAFGKKKCKSGSRQVSDCCTTHPGDYCRNCNKGG